MEIWKRVAEFPVYYVSNLGRVANTSTGRILRPRKSGKGYRSVCLGAGNYRAIHRLVAIAFHPNPKGLPQVNHLDGVKSNNRSDNLAWASSNENMKHAFDTGLLSNTACCNPKSGAEHKRSKPICFIEDDGMLLIHFESMCQAAKLTGIDYSSIHGASTGKFAFAGGRQWRKTQEA